MLAFADYILHAESAQQKLYVEIVQGNETEKSFFQKNIQKNRKLILY